jgi:hypothetical protein
MVILCRVRMNVDYVEWNGSQSKYWKSDEDEDILLASSSLESPFHPFGTSPKLPPSRARSFYLTEKVGKIETKTSRGLGKEEATTVELVSIDLTVDGRRHMLLWLR